MKVDKDILFVVGAGVLLGHLLMTIGYVLFYFLLPEDRFPQEYGVLTHFLAVTGGAIGAALVGRRLWE